MSTKLLVLQKGILVDQYNQLLKPQIKELKQQIEEPEDFHHTKCHIAD
jgi:hypothetical protein